MEFVTSSFCRCESLSLAKDLVIFSMHTLLMEPFHNYTKVKDLVTLSLTFMMKTANLDLITAGCINFVFRKHISCL